QLIVMFLLLEVRPWLLRSRNTEDQGTVERGAFEFLARCVVEDRLLGLPFALGNPHLQRHVTSRDQFPYLLSTPASEFDIALPLRQGPSISRLRSRAPAFRRRVALNRRDEIPMSHQVVEPFEVSSVESGRAGLGIAVEDRGHFVVGRHGGKIFRLT